MVRVSQPDRCGRRRGASESEIGMLEGSFAEGVLASGQSWRIHYQVQGEGPDVVLLHGGGPGATGASNYGKNIEALSKRFRCWIIDFPGWGKSSKNLAAFNAEGPFQNGARAVLAFMDAVELRRAHFIGNSFGGAAALCLAMEAPERADKLVLMGPGGGVVPGATGPTEGIRQLLTYYMDQGPTLEKLQAFIGNLVYDGSRITPELIRERFEASCDPELCANPPLTLSAVPPGKQMFIGLDPRLATLEHHALFVWGLQDRVNPAAGMEPFRAMRNADFWLIANCGHWAQWEHPERFNDVVGSFLARS
jgi:pimeloyl-ACP methyl ester carboxylesterase